MVSKIIAWIFLSMCATISLGIIIAVAGLPWGNKVVQVIEPIVTTDEITDLKVEILPTGDWLSYQAYSGNNISFLYPPERGRYIPSGGKMSDGNYKSADVALIENHQIPPHDLIINIVASSPGASLNQECSLSYSDEPIDLSLSDKLLKERIEARFGPISNLKRTPVSGQQAVSFFRTVNCSERTETILWVTNSYLLPYQSAGYTNLLITGPALNFKRVSLNEMNNLLSLSSELLKQTIKGDFLNNFDIGRRWQVFNTMLNTIKFPDGY